METQLLISVIERGLGDRALEITREAGATGGTVIMGRGSVQNSLLRMLFLGDLEKEIIFTLGTKEELRRIIAALQAATDIRKKRPAVGILLDVTAFYRLPSRIKTSDTLPKLEGPKMSKHELICVVANTGYADDIMDAARKAGATGGTIIKARGTSTETENNFFGLTIVPEKEMVLIVVKNEQYEPILSAVKACPCLTETGVGIVFSLPVEDFFFLGLGKK